MRAMPRRGPASRKASAIRDGAALILDGHFPREASPEHFRLA